MPIHDPNFHKLGRRPKKLTMRTPRMVSYISTSVLPKVPPSVLYGQKVSNWGMLLNDTEGDCTAAGIGHAYDLWNSECGVAFNATDSDAQALYVAVTGIEGAAFDPATGANDNGCVENDVLTYIQKNGFAGQALNSFAFVNAHDLNLIKATIWLFGCCYVGVDLPISAQNQEVWDYNGDPSGDNVPGSWGGHCILLIGFDDSSGLFTCVTWGATRKLSYAWWNEYGDEAWGMLSPDWIAKSNLSPSDFDLVQLQQDIKLI